MRKVLVIGTGFSSMAYIMCGAFGFITFSMRDNVCQIMNEQNILKADYNGNVVIKVCLIGVLFVVLFASPFCILPCKDSIEELTMKDGVRFSKKQNFLCTLGISILAWVIALTVPKIADIMTILGATTNTFVGFLLPIIFFLKI
jgi:amino acid permease